MNMLHQLILKPAVRSIDHRYQGQHDRYFENAKHGSERYRYRRLTSVMVVTGR